MEENMLRKGLVVVCIAMMAFPSMLSAQSGAIAVERTVQGGGQQTANAEQPALMAMATGEYANPVRNHDTEPVYTVDGEPELSGISAKDSADTIIDLSGLKPEQVQAELRTIRRELDAWKSDTSAMTGVDAERVLREIVRLEFKLNALQELRQNGSVTLPPGVAVRYESKVYCTSHDMSSLWRAQASNEPVTLKRYETDASRWIRPIIRQAALENMSTRDVQCLVWHVSDKRTTENMSQGQRDFLRRAQVLPAYENELLLRRIFSMFVKLDSITSIYANYQHEMNEMIRMVNPYPTSASRSFAISCAASDQPNRADAVAMAPLLVDINPSSSHMKSNQTIANPRSNPVALRFPTDNYYRVPDQQYVQSGGNDFRPSNYPAEQLQKDADTLRRYKDEFQAYMRMFNDMFPELFDAFEFGMEQVPYVSGFKTCFEVLSGENMLTGATISEQKRFEMFGEYLTSKIKDRFVDNMGKFTPQGAQLSSVAFETLDALDTAERIKRGSEIIRNVFARY